LREILATYILGFVRERFVIPQYEIEIRAGEAGWNQVL
jgi:hypothetical protein